ncbi:MAG: hypothetical protein V7K35_25960 [Nostoc sp.]|uniref:hypothetical protein n=1 Tax=Nostoc sp. TaxID=1180 RepID=UPI002FF515E0
MTIYLSPNRFDANIQDFSGLLNGDSFAAEVEIFMLLIVAHCGPALSGMRSLRRATPTLRNYKFLYCTYKIAPVVLSLVSHHSW